MTGAKGVTEVHEGEKQSCHRGQGLDPRGDWNATLMSSDMLLGMKLGSDMVRTVLRKDP